MLGVLGEAAAAGLSVAGAIALLGAIFRKA